MAWYKPNTWFADNSEKLNPAQEMISREQGLFINTNAVISYAQAFDKLESVNRGVNMIVSAASSLDYDIKDKEASGIANGVRQKTLNNLLNYTPNPYQSAQDFRNNLFLDFILEGNIFIYYDGVHLYHLPASHVTIETDTKTFVSLYTYNRTITFKPDEIIHIKDLNSVSIYRGTSRLVSADRNIKILYKMQTFQEQFFENGAVAGLIFTSENTLSQIAKDKTIANWQARYSPKNGARKPMILDSGLKPFSNLTQTFTEMDFEKSVDSHNAKILRALGVPPILLEGGNNANISPNLRLFYLETVIPVVTKFVSALERYFGYDIAPVTYNVSALQPELKDVAAYNVSLVNGGIITPNEARVELRYPSMPGFDELRIPANIAGSAVNPNIGGAPPKPPADGAAPKPPAGGKAQ
jgi:HK97 family phage portal protein